MTETRERLLEAFVIALLLEDYKNLAPDDRDHPDDIEWRRKTRKAVKRVLAYYGAEPLAAKV